jgi:hypothetical protein
MLLYSWPFDEQLTGTKDLSQAGQVSVKLQPVAWSQSARHWLL